MWQLQCIYLLHDIKIYILFIIQIASISLIMHISVLACFAFIYFNDSVSSNFKTLIQWNQIRSFNSKIK